MQTSERERALFEVAQHQGGYFTAKQAACLGYTASMRNYHVAAGNWIREHRGIFRLSLFPLPERPDLMLWWLWSRGRDDNPLGVFSHITALSLHELTDANPAHIDLTVPPHFRKGSPVPPVLRLHFADVTEREKETIADVPVTNALRTILDVAKLRALPITQLRLALEQALNSGRLTRGQLTEARNDPRNATLLCEIERDAA